MYKVGRSRTPQGVRGLKPFTGGIEIAKLMSHSARSAWIETNIGGIMDTGGTVALRKECVD